LSELHHPDKIDRDYIRLLQAMSRFIKEEFSIAIRMTQENAVEQLLHYAEQSRNSMLQEMGKELREFTYGPEAKDAGTAQAEQGQEEGMRYYRGAPVGGSAPSDKKSEKAPAPAEKTPANKTKSTRVYRGQIVNI